MKLIKLIFSELEKNNGNNWFIMFLFLGFAEIYESCEDTTLIKQEHIISTNYPSNYPSNVDCNWRLKAQAGNRVLLSFSDFDVDDFGKDYSSVCFDYIEIFNVLGKIKYINGTFCNKNRPPASMLSQGNEIRISFHSSAWYHYKGFNISYKSVRPG